MTREVRQFETVQKLFGDLEALALSPNSNFVFRGHQYEKKEDKEWKIDTTYARYTSTPHQGWDSNIDEMITKFLGRSLALGSIPFPLRDRRSRLEYARHHGLPTPVTDYTYSPYVALHFAFGGLQYRHGPKGSAPPPNAVVYALDIQLLGQCWAKEIASSDKFYEVLDNFRYERPHYFDQGYRGGDLKFIPSCASWNSRMRNQLGCLIYDTLNYSHFGCKDFEDWVHTLKEPDPPHGERMQPLLIKFLIPHSAAKDVLSRLELMTISGTRLQDHSGVAADVIQEYNYTSRIPQPWDLSMPPPNDT